MDISGQIHSPVALPPDKEPTVPTVEDGLTLYYALTKRKKISVSTGNVTPLVQPLA
jgi:hypothetical protein